jgi:KRAB domain-containing zinc finger protein
MPVEYNRMCKKYFKQSDTLKMHIHTHTGKWPFTCGVCWKSFKQFGALEMHLHNHTV